MINHFNVVSDKFYHWLPLKNESLMSSRHVRHMYFTLQFRCFILVNGNQVQSTIFWNTDIFKKITLKVIFNNYWGLYRNLVFYFKNHGSEGLVFILKKKKNKKRETHLSNSRQ